MAHEAIIGPAAVRPGWAVCDAGGEEVGEVLAVGSAALRVLFGLFAPKELDVPAAAVARVEDGRVYLAVARDDVLRQGWPAAPAGTTPAG